jgi:membrane protease YdiL (CAAX protease family)
MLLGVEVVAVSYGLIVQAVGWRQPITLSADVATVFGGGGVGLVLSVLLVALVAPVAEELAFRGVILPAIGERWGQWPAILISAALFAAYHVNLWLFIPMLVFGTALGWLTVARRSLWPAIAMHVLYNSLAVAAAFIVPR